MATFFFIDDADTTHEDASDWYSSYGWHMSTDAGDIELQAVHYDWLDDLSDSDIADRLTERYPDLSDDDAAEIVERAREIRDCAESICSHLDDAVAAYEARDYAACVAALDAATGEESDHGDTPASSQLRRALLADVEVKF